MSRGSYQFTTLGSFPFQLVTVCWFTLTPSPQIVAYLTSWQRRKDSNHPLGTLNHSMVNCSANSQVFSRYTWPEIGICWLRLHWNHSHVKILGTSFGLPTLIWIEEFSFSPQNHSHFSFTKCQACRPNHADYDRLTVVVLEVQLLHSLRMFSSHVSPHLHYKDT